MKKTTTQITVDGRKYDLRLTRTESFVSAQAFLKDKPVGPLIKIDYTLQQLDDYEAQGGDSSDMIRAIVESAIGFVRDNVKASE